MGKSARLSALVVVVLLISTPNVIAVYAQSVPMPSVPKFTLKLVAYPYDVAPTTTMDPYTGKNVTTEEGYHVENQSIQITITNQPYSYTFNGTNYQIFYNVRVKGHFEADNWKETYDYDYYYNTNYHYSNYPPQSDSSYTILSEPNIYNIGDQVDFQVKAVVMHVFEVYRPPQAGIGGYFGGGYANASLIDAESGWSNTQTITLSEPLPSVSSSPTPELTPSPTVPASSLITPSPNPTPFPTQPITKEVFPIWVIAVFAALVFVIGVLVGVVVMMRRRLRSKSVVE